LTGPVASLYQEAVSSPLRDPEPQVSSRVLETFEHTTIPRRPPGDQFCAIELGTRTGTRHQLSETGSPSSRGMALLQWASAVHLLDSDTSEPMSHLRSEC